MPATKKVTGPCKHGKGATSFYLVDNLQPDFASVVVAEPVEESVGLSTGKATQQDGLAKAAGLA